MKFCAGTGMGALALALAAPAWADCTPSPAAQVQTICTGSITEGVIITTRFARVNTEAGSSVVPGSADAAFIIKTRNVPLNISGTVDGGNKPGLVVTPGSETDFTQFATFLGISSGGLLTGTNAIQFGLEPGNSSTATMSFTNLGTIRGTSGTAIVSSDPNAVFQSLSVLEGGRIEGGIVGTVMGFLQCRHDRRRKHQCRARTGRYDMVAVLRPWI